MAEYPAILRGFGVLQPPQPKVRAFLSATQIAAQRLATGLFMAFGIAMVVFTTWLPTPLNWVGSVATFAAFFIFIYAITRYDFSVIELEGDVLKTHHLYTGKMIERQVKDIDYLVTLFTREQGLAKALNERLWGRIKGMEVRFRDRRTPLKILRADPAMIGAQELIEAILYRMSQIAELEPTIIDRSGQPIVQNIHWKGASAQQGPPWLFRACLMMGIALLFGLILGAAGCQDQKLLDVSSKPSHQMTLSELIKEGPGDNRHVTVTDFEAGGYYFEKDRSGVWSQIWIAIFPTVGPKTEIEAVVYSKAIEDETALRQFLRSGKITGACSAEKDTYWGATLGPALVKFNGNRPLKAAWQIHELHHPPSRETVQALFFGSYACFAVALLISAVIVGSGLMPSVKCRHE